MPWWGPTALKVVGTFLLALGSAYVGFWQLNKEQWLENETAAEAILLEQNRKDREQLRVANRNEDSIRNSDKTQSYAFDQIVLMKRKSVTNALPSPIRGTRLSKWYRSNPFSDNKFENFDMLEVVFEMTDGDAFQFETLFDPTNIQKHYPFIQDFLGRVIDTGPFFVYDANDLTAEMRAVVNPQFEQWYYKDKGITVGILYYIGETSDFREKYFLSATIDSADYDTYSKKQKIQIAVRHAGNQIRNLFRLKQGTNTIFPTFDYASD